MDFLFQLGHQPLISTAELEAVLSSAKDYKLKLIKHQGIDYLILQTDKKIEPEKLIGKLGGIVKIAQFACPNNQTDLLNYLTVVCPNGKIEYSLNNPKLALELKKQLKNLGRTVRYIEIKNTATILYNKLTEKKTDLTGIDNQIFATVAIQPFVAMAKRDFARPGSDDISGMLPPKLARIMINLTGVDPNSETVLLDPFCGSGTILNEAASLGYTQIIGSDISEKAVKDSKKNLEWLLQTYKLAPINYQLMLADATKISEKLKKDSVDIIVSETYLGKPLKGRENKTQLEKQIQELKELYLNSFKELHKILKPGGIIVMAIPKFKFQNNWLPLDLKNPVEKIGFTTIPFHNEATLLYHRPNQHLGREIYRFKKTLS